MLESISVVNDVRKPDQVLGRLPFDLWRFADDLVSRRFRSGYFILSFYTQSSGT